MVENSLYYKIIQKLAQAGIASPRLEARILIGHSGNIDPALVTESTILNNSALENFEKNLQLRLQHKPLDKIIGRKEFFKYTFKVNEDVLTPRPDTEILVEAALDIIPENMKYSILDLGSGSGCIILSLLKERPLAFGRGIDISEGALAIARENCRTMELENRCTFINADWFKDNIYEYTGKNFDLIVSNPPYIPIGDISGLEPEVQRYDPLLALDGGQDGLNSYRRIAEIAVNILNPNGLIILEIGIGQSEQILSIFEKNGFLLSRIDKDLSGIERCIIFRKKDCN